MASVDTGNAWAVFRAYLDAVAARATDELVPRWKDRLGGADVFTLLNAWAMAVSLRLDLSIAEHRRELAGGAEHFPCNVTWVILDEI